MRPRLIEFRFLPLAVCLAVMVLASPAGAGDRLHDRVYADSFDNLVIHSPSGYKRIVVGRGHLAQELADYQRPSGPDVLYPRRGEGYDMVPYWCWKPAVLLKGRSYMYGLEDGELPDLPGKWCGFRQGAAPGAAIRRVQP